jgi:4-hydroxy-3-methylbut-2-enyl diphosphate reductase
VPDVVLLASPRGWCAGVARALAMVEQELDGPAPVYLRHAIVHNASVVDGLADRGVATVEDLHDVPEGATVVLSAHGVSPTVRAEAEARGLGVVDATCPLVSKVHAEVRRFASAGYTVVVIGHRDHVEVVGTMGEAPQHTVLVETVADVEALSPPDPERVAWVCQTTLSVTDAAEVVEAVRHRFPAAVSPRTEDICYATTNRQDAVVELARRSDLVLVLGSPTSSNSRRMVERARETGCRAELVENHHAIPDGLLVDVRVVGLTSGASAPERLVSEAVEWFGETWGARVEELTVRAEDVHFSVPPPRWRQA